MKRYPNDPMHISAYDFYDLGVSMQRSSKPSKIYVPNDIQMPEDIQVPPKMPMPDDYVQMPMPEEEYEEYDAGKEEEDKSYMISLYPDLCRRIQFYVDEECDRLDYEGSIMYDDYPDKEAVMDIVGKIYLKVEKECKVPKMTHSLEEGVSDKETSDVEAQQYGFPGNIWLRDNIQVQFLNELFGRRRRRFPRRFYQQYPYPYRYRYFRRYPRYPYFPYQPYVPYSYRYYY